jgi:hypothetical protein
MKRVSGPPETNPVRVQPAPDPARVQSAPFKNGSKGKVVFREHAVRRLLDNPCISVILSIFVIFALVAIGVPVFLALELSERRESDSAAAAEHREDVEAISNSTKLSPLQQEAFVEYLGGPPETKSDEDYVFEYILLAFSIIATIGYGNIYPLNGGSRFFCVVYALIGIPIAGILFSHTSTTIFKALESLMVKHVSKFNLQDIFSKLDTDGNASLTREEIKQAIIEAGACSFFVCVWLSMTQVYDICITLVLLGLNLKEEDIDLAFQKADTGDGSLDKLEFVKMLTKLNMNAGDFHVSEIKSLVLLIIFLLWWILGGAIFSSVEGCL